MTKIILSGCNGQMGKSITHCIQERQDCAISAGLDINTESTASYPVVSSPSELPEGGDVIIDFSHPSVLSGLLAYARAKKLPIVVATTGLSEQQVEEIHTAAKEIPVFYTANMSLGVNLMAELARKAAAVLGQNFDIEIVEKHHNKKVDAPSGTALLLANEINDQLNHQKHYVYERQSVRQKRDPAEIGIHSVRGGTIVGEHDIIFAGQDEIFTLSHTALSKGVFATGAVNAGCFLVGKAPGLYSMKQLIG